MTFKYRQIHSFICIIYLQVHNKVGAIFWKGKTLVIYARWSNLVFSFEIILFISPVCSFRPGLVVWSGMTDMTDAFNGCGNFSSMTKACGLSSIYQEQGIFQGKNYWNASVKFKLLGNQLLRQKREQNIYHKCKQNAWIRKLEYFKERKCHMTHQNFRKCLQKNKWKT